MPNPTHTEPCIVYKITHTASGRVFIGSTITTLRQRWIEHQSDAATLKYAGNLLRAIKRDGPDAFTIEALEGCAPSEHRARENHWMRRYNALVDGYNTLPVRLYLVFDLHGVLLREHDSMREFARETGVPQSSFRDCLSGKQARAGSYIVMYKEEYSPGKLKAAVERVQKGSQKNTGKAFNVLREGKVIGTYTARSVCARELELIPQKIGSCLQSGGTHRGYTFEYVLIN